MGNALNMGNAESTSRIVCMQAAGGAITVTDAVDVLRGDRRRIVKLAEGEKIVHEDDLEKIFEEGRKSESKKLKAERTAWLTQQAEERRHVITEEESKWKRLLEETSEKEKETLRVQFEEEEKEKINQLEIHWKLIIEEAKKEQKDALSAQFEAEQKVAEVEALHTDQEVADLENKYKMLEKQLQNEKEALRLQFEEDSNQKLQEAESKWKATLEETAEQVQKEKEELQMQMVEQGKKDAEAVEAQRQESLRGELEEVKNEKETLLCAIEEEGRQKLEEVEAKWQQIFEQAAGANVHVNNVEDAKTVIDEIEARWTSKLEEKEKEHMDKIKSIEHHNLPEDMLQKLHEEKEALRLQFEEESTQKLQEAEAKWKATMEETTEQVQKGEDVTNEKEILLAQIEDEQKQKLEEVDAKWQQIFEQAAGANVHVNNVKDAKTVIDEIEQRWTSKLEEKEKEHMDKIKSIEDDHSNETNQYDSKLVEQDKLVNDMLEKLQVFESRGDDVRQQFITSAEKVETQLRPLKPKAVCIESRNIALNCQKENANETLRCSEVVKKFMDCVQSERIAFLERSAAK